VQWRGGDRADAAAHRGVLRDLGAAVGRPGASAVSAVSAESVIALLLSLIEAAVRGSPRNSQDLLIGVSFGC
jgi:hypothetical protein